MSQTRLVYESAPSIRRWPKYVRRAGITLALLASVCVAAYVAPQAVYLARQAECLRYRAASDAVVFEGDPEHAAGWLTRPHYQPVPLSPTMLPRPTAPAAAAAAISWPGELARLGWQLTPRWGTHGVAFMHERRTTTGTRRLVVVTMRLNEAFNAFGCEGQAVNMTGVVLEPATLLPKRKVTAPAHRRRSVQVEAGRGRSLRIFAGQPDPSDTSRFSIRYEVDGRTGWVDGWMRDAEDWVFDSGDEIVNCERIEFTIRPPSAAATIRSSTQN